MGCCLGCFRNNDYVNEVNKNNTPSTNELSNASGPKPAVQDTQKKNERENGMQVIKLHLLFLDKQHKWFRL